MRTFHFHTIYDGNLTETYWVPVQGTSIRDAVRTLRTSLREGETIVGWAS